jgi:hypothetical protein
MGDLGFDVKSPRLLADERTGLPRLHPDVRGMLDWLVETCAREQLARPVVTCFGRTRAEQEAIYLPTYLQTLPTRELALQHARARFSWHCVPKDASGELGFCRAMDLRYWVWTDQARAHLLEEARRRWPNAELLDHAVPGGSRHLHFGLPAPLRPVDWL